MNKRQVAVLGGGVAGLTTALLLARRGHSVTVLERDPFPIGEAMDSPTWNRKGIPHFLQPHAFMPRGRKILRERLPDVYESLIEAGARDVDMRKKLPGEVSQGDEDLQYLAVRRPLIEWALRRAVLSEPLIDVRSDNEVSGLCIEGLRVTGVKVGTSQLPADVVIDALGRRTKTPEWLAQLGLDATPVESSDCGVVYFSRYYRLLDDFDLPDGNWLLGPRGDLGYMGYSTFPGDNRTFSALLAVPPGRVSSRALKESAMFEAVIAEIPSMRQWVNPEGTEPITEVLTMAGLRNTLRDTPLTSVTGLFQVGDSICHGDPVLALGLSFAMLHAVELVDIIGENEDVATASGAYFEAIAPLMRERFDYATKLDDQRLRMWNGEKVEFASRDGAYELFSIIAGGVAALVDPDVFRVVVRRNGLLESLRVLDEDRAMQVKIEQIFRAAAAAPRPTSGPSLDEMEAILRRAGGSAD